MDGSVCIVSTIITCPLLMDNMDYRTRFYGDTRTRIYPAQTYEFTPYVRRNLTFTHREHGETMNVSSPWPPFCLIEPETLITLLHDLAARVATASDDHAYGDNTAVWFENGNKVLDYIERDQRFSPDSFKESLEEQGVRVRRADLAILVGNMRSLAAEWRNSIGAHDELVFYIDAC